MPKFACFMKKHLTAPIFKIISECATDLDTPAYVVGGFVRDLFLGRGSKDIDIVVTGNGIDLAKHVAARLSHTPRGDGI
jgi:poly(A) polymerase